MTVTSTDPVFAAIAQRRKVFAAYDGHLDREPGGGDPQHRAWEVMRGNLGRANLKAEQKLFGTAATSKEGLLAYLAEIKKRQRQSGELEAKDLNNILATVARAVRRM